MRKWNYNFRKILTFGTKTQQQEQQEEQKEHEKTRSLVKNLSNQFYKMAK